VREEPGSFLLEERQLLVKSGAELPSRHIKPMAV